MDAGKHIVIWNDCLKFIRNNIEPAQFKTWFEPLRAVAYEDSVLTIEVPSHFFREYLDKFYLSILKAALRKMIGDEAKLRYKVTAVCKQPAVELPASEGNAAVNRPITVNTSVVPDSHANPFAFPGVKRVTVNPRLKPDYCFNTLVKGECNKMGITAGLTIADQPGTTPFNPLFIFGSSGLGKTHLAQAIGNEIKRLHPELVVLYVTGNEFKTQYVKAVNVDNKLSDFLAFYMRIEVLIIDDIQDLAGPGSQNAFFNVFNYLHENGRQLIFTSDRAPVELQNFEQRLLSRMKWGLSVELQRPGYATRLEMLKQKAFREGVPIRNEVLEYLATKIKSNFRELEGTLTSIIANATLLHQEITVDLAEQVAARIVNDEKEEITINAVSKTVCDYFNITKETLLSKSRKRQIVQARQIAMYVSRDLINCSLSTIGSELGGKDHATVLHAIGTVSDLMATDRVFKQYVTDIEKMLVPVR